MRTPVKSRNKRRIRTRVLSTYKIDCENPHIVCIRQQLISGSFESEPEHIDRFQVIQSVKQLSFFSLNCKSRKAHLELSSDRFGGLLSVLTSQKPEGLMQTLLIKHQGSCKGKASQHRNNVNDESCSIVRTTAADRQPIPQLNRVRITETLQGRPKAKAQQQQHQHE